MINDEKQLSVTPAEGGANNIGSCGSDHLHDPKQDEAAAVVEPPMPDDSPAAVGSDVISTEEMSDIAWKIADLENEKAEIEEKYEALVEGVFNFSGFVANWCGRMARPMNLFECREMIEDKLSRQLALIEAGNLALGEAHALIGKTTTTESPAMRYIVADSYILTDSHSEAQRHAMASADVTGQPVIIAAVNTALHVQVQPA